MKRIANKVAVQTILYVVNPYQKIRILDGYTWRMDNLVERYNGNERDFSMTYVPRGVSQYQIEYAKVRGIKAEGDVLNIYINTKEDTIEDY